MKAERGGATCEAPGSSALRFLRSAKLCRVRDLEQIAVVCELVKDMSGLIHALQKERGASSIYLGSNGARFAEALNQRIAECRTLERIVRDRLEHLDERLDRMSSGARFYKSVALALVALDGLAGIRSQTTGLALAPQDAVAAFTAVIGRLLAVVFEASDIAVDPAVSRALVALVNFIQGKEYAGQERATAGAAFSRGHINAAEHQRLLNLATAQDRAFRTFAEFAEPAQAAACRASLFGPDADALERMRQIALTGGPAGDLNGVSGEAWYEQATRRIDAMKGVEDRLAAELGGLCAATLAQARAELDRPDFDRVADDSGDAQGGGMDTGLPVALLVMEADPALADLSLGRSVDGAVEGGAGLYALDGIRPRLMRSVVDLVQAQSRRIQDMRCELETARTALNERKVIDRAKGLLMTSRGLSEEEAYTLMRKAAMNQNKRIVEVAEAVVSMADILKGLGG